jgi:hypothetical protein
METTQHSVRLKHSILEEIVHSQDDSINFMETLIEHCAIPPRELVQAYMIWKFKYYYGEERREDPGMESAAEQYVERGYAKAFANIYDGRCNLHTMEQRLYGEPPSINPIR